MYQDSQTTGTAPENNQGMNTGENAYQNTYQNANYQQYPYNNYTNGNYGNNYQMPYQPPQMELEEPVKMGEWLVAMLLMMVPCVNIVMMFVWAFSKTEKKSKSNFFKAYLVMFGVLFALYFVLLIVIVAAGIANF